MSVQLEELLPSVRDVFGEFFTIDRQKTAPEPHFLIQRNPMLAHSPASQRCWRIIIELAHESRTFICSITICSAHLGLSWVVTGVLQIWTIHGSAT